MAAKPCVLFILTCVSASAGCVYAVCSHHCVSGAVVDMGLQLLLEQIIACLDAYALVVKR